MAEVCFTFSVLLLAPKNKKAATKRPVGKQFGIIMDMMSLAAAGRAWVQTALLHKVAAGSSWTRVSLLTSAGAGFGLYLLFLIWKVVAHIVLLGAVPREQHSLLCALFFIICLLMCVPASLPFMSAACFFFFFLVLTPLQSFPDLLLFWLWSGVLFSFICFAGQNTKG